MRLLALLACLAFLLSGCAEDAPSADPDDDGCDAACEADLGTDPQDADSDDDGALDGADDAPARVPPQDVVFTGSLKGVGYGALLPVAPPVDPVPQCALDDRQCAFHTVTVPAGTWTVTMTLHGDDGTATSAGGAGGLGTDYDLFVEGVGDSTNAAGEDDVVKADLKAGDYTAQVLAWNDVDGGYTLTIHFE
jgi:hypothetical protein